MPTTLIVLAHPDKRSFNGAWADETERVARAQGDEVLRSDLCQMGFDPVEGPGHYPDWSQNPQFDPLKVQEEAAQADALPQDVRAEVDKVKRADRVVFHFPLWWFAPPAVLKGWFDRVFVHGALHSVDQRFDRGLCRSKQALLCVTTGSSAAESAFNGKEGDVGMLLWPTAYTLRYLGFTVLTPEVVHGVHGYHKAEARQRLAARLRAVLEAQAPLMASFDSHPRLSFNRDSDFDRGGTLYPDRPSHNLFIRHSRDPGGD